MAIFVGLSGHHPASGIFSNPEIISAELYYNAATNYNQS